MLIINVDKEKCRWECCTTFDYLVLVLGSADQSENKILEMS